MERKRSIFYAAVDDPLDIVNKGATEGTIEIAPKDDLAISIKMHKRAHLRSRLRVHLSCTCGCTC